MPSELPQQARRYVQRFTACLAQLPSDERQDLAKELESHLMDAYSRTTDDPLAELGTPEQYAHRFVSEHQLSRAVTANNPVGLVRALLVSARGAVVVFFVVFPLAGLYLTGLGMVFVATLKPFIPDHIGVFAQGGHIAEIG